MHASAISAFQMLKLSVGPSSSHTHGPIVIGNLFRRHLEREGISHFKRLTIRLYWSMARTGKGHRTDNAIIAGLLGYDPIRDDLDTINSAQATVNESGFLDLGIKRIRFDIQKDFIWSPYKRLPDHENGISLTLLREDGTVVCERNYYSIGGGMVREEGQAEASEDTSEPCHYAYASEWLTLAREQGVALSEIVKQNTAVLENQTIEETTAQMGLVWNTMKTCIQRGLDTQEELLPGSLRVRRRAPHLMAAAIKPRRTGIFASNDICRYATAFAYAVSEENAASGRVVTAPTNGGAGVLPGVMYASQYLDDFSDAQVVEVLFTAAGLGGLIQANASISGSEVGCQGEVGAACSMAAGAVCQLFGGDNYVTEYAAEIAMEHSLGLECTPMKGYVQIPCIERNGIFAQKALAAAQHAITLGHHRISLDMVIAKMYENGKHMDPDFKETSRKGFGPSEPDLSFPV